MRCVVCTLLRLRVSRVSRGSNLRRHERTHTDERPYACPECDYRAAQKITLTDHIKRKHEGSRDYACSGCLYTAVTMGDLRSHTRKGACNSKRRRVYAERPLVPVVPVAVAVPVAPVAPDWLVAADSIAMLVEASQTR